MSSIHELLKQVYPLKLRMELFNAIWTNWREDVNEKDQRIAELEEQLKKSQNQKAIEELEKLKENAWKAATDIFQLIDYAELYKIINSQIKSLKGEE